MTEPTTAAPRPTHRECDLLRDGALTAHLEGLHRLGGLLDAVSALAEMRHDPSTCTAEPRADPLLARLFAAGQRVSTDLITSRAKRAEETT